MSSPASEHLKKDNLFGCLKLRLWLVEDYMRWSSDLWMTGWWVGVRIVLVPVNVWLSVQVCVCACVCLPGPCHASSPPLGSLCAVCFFFFFALFEDE